MQLDVIAVRAVTVLVVFLGYAVAKKECTVCEKLMTKFVDSLDSDTRESEQKIEDAFRKLCSKATGKNERLCYMIGGLETSATGILKVMSKPITYHLPANKICEKLNAKDSQVCELREDVPIDLVNANLKKMKVKDLKRILDEWGETCKMCTEKSEYVRMVEDLMPKYDPESAAKRAAAREDL